MDSINISTSTSTSSKNKKKSKMSEVKTSIQINEEGLQHLQYYHYGDAIDSFHEALSVLLDEPSNGSCSSLEFDELLWEQKSQFERKQHGPITKRNVVFPEGTDCTPLPVADIHNDFFTMFQHGLNVRTELARLNFSAEPCKKLLIAVCFYNAGLAHHLLGLQNNSADRLTRAAEHYSISYARFLDCSASPLGRVLQLPLGVLASVNNLCHLHAYFRNLDQVAICVEELSQLMSACLVESKLEGCRVFLQNICFFQESVLCSAPAA